MDLYTAQMVALGLVVVLILLEIRRYSAKAARQREEAEIQGQYEEQTRRLTKEMSESSRNLLAEQQKYDAERAAALTDQSIEAQADEQNHLAELVTLRKTEF